MSNQIKQITVNELPIEIQEDAIYSITQPNPNSYTHSYFKYPCKFIPEIPRWAINKFIGNINQAVVLDPFAGSGTTLLEASIRGVESVGTEIDNIAKLIIKVKTTKITNEQLIQMKAIVNEIIYKLENDFISSEEIILPQISNLNHWFNQDVLKELGYIYHTIMQVSDERVRDFLCVCMASIIKKVSNADDISPKPYVSNKIKKIPPKVSKTFQDAFEKYILSMQELNRLNLSNVTVAGNALNIPSGANQIDLAITSPPYINAFDYVRTLRLENLWLQLATEDELRKKKKEYVGTESIISKQERENLEILKESKLLNECFEQIKLVDEKRALITKKFFEDMKTNLIEVHRVLKPGSAYCIVIGNSNIRNIEVESWKIIKDIALLLGYKYENHIGYVIQNPYIRIPRKGKGGKISIDHVLIIRKQV